MRPYTNVKGQAADPTTAPPDLERCQACPNMLGWSPMTLGPKPKPIRCSNVPEHVAVENKPAADGRVGSMSLCRHCLALFKQHFQPTFAKIHPVTREVTK